MSAGVCGWSVGETAREQIGLVCLHSAGRAPSHRTKEAGAPARAALPPHGIKASDEKIICRVYASCHRPPSTSVQRYAHVD